MADNYAICTLLGAMDHLWFHQIILFPHSLFAPKSPKTPLPFSESFTSNLSASSCTSIPEEQGLLSSDESAITPQQDNDYEIEEKEKIIQDNDSEIEEREKIIEVLKKTRPSRLNIVKTHSNSSSPSSTPNKLSKSRRRYSGSVMRLQKTMSCKSLGELEVEEVKGFMDLGFRFDTEHLCPRMMSVVPGLQRLGSCNNMLQKDMMLDDKLVLALNNKDDDHEIEEDAEKIKRPYLSEAWLIRRPDSPLLNLRIPRASAAADMKKHLKHWARTVASVIQQES